MAADPWRWARQGRRRFPHVRIPFFRIFYSTTYTSLYVVLLVILAIAPTTLIYDSISNAAYQYIFMVGGAYVATATVTLLLYSSRLYSNRSTLAGVGKSFIPIEEDEVGKKVRREIVKGLKRSALIAVDIAPRDLTDPKPSRHNPDSNSTDCRTAVDASRPPWGLIERPGWSAPESDAAASHIYYKSVVLELPNLIEASIVSLAQSQYDMDPEVVESLYKRSPGAGLRDHLTLLDASQLVHFSPVIDTFIVLYEQARFRPLPLTTTEFRQLMDVFTELLSGIDVSDPPRHFIKSEEKGTGHSPAVEPEISLGNLQVPSEIRAADGHSDRAITPLRLQPPRYNSDGSVRWFRPMPDQTRSISSRASSLRSVLYAAREPL